MIVFICSKVEGQFLKLGFRVEPALFLMNENQNSSTGFSPYNIYLTSIIQPTKWLNIELRPGYLIGTSDYGGFEVGVFTRIIFPLPEIYLIAGLNNHSNFFDSAHNGGGGYIKNILYKGIGIGYQKDSKLSIDLIYYWTDDKVFAYINNITSIGRYKVDTEMNGILKIGFSLAWDIL